MNIMRMVISFKKIFWLFINSLLKDIESAKKLEDVDLYSDIKWSVKKT